MDMNIGLGWKKASTMHPGCYYNDGKMWKREVIASPPWKCVLSHKNGGQQQGMSARQEIIGEKYYRKSSSLVFHDVTFQAAKQVRQYVLDLSNKLNPKGICNTDFLNAQISKFP